MVIARYVLCVIVSLLATLFAMLLVNWWAPAFCDAQGNLPRWLKWFQTFDASCDAGWRDGYIDASWGATPVRRFFARVYWLYRNPAYGWDYWPLGVPFVPTDWRVVRYTDTDALTLFVAVGGDGFNVYYNGRWGMLKVGWKAWNCWDGTTWKAMPFGPEWRLPVCFTLTPFKRK
ncbi:hypothetical protein [Ralstonia pseudosolanacearum]|uniref:DUF7338 family protein n=1 Tax=Ralstonia pseudosolanacearum TaxID=1310165 RepID=UPI0008DB2BDA|nr:hypothetical protein [Ralstonia pseudosolanacearum]MCL1618321.1 hypothetical protein [Ralstonia pseudosolanacearum CaRs-Mep]